MNPIIHRPSIIIVAIVTLLLGGCAGLQPEGNLSQVKFTLDRVSNVHVAGIDVSKIQSVDDLNMFQVARATLAATRKQMPLELTLHLKSANPIANGVAARIVRMHWTLMLDGRETISGTIDRPVEIPAGGMQEIPLHLSLNMFDYFNEKSATALLELAFAFAGEGGGIPHGVALKIRPTVDTPFGPIKYGSPITIEPSQERND